jgi:hypothetical protein
MKCHALRVMVLILLTLPATIISQSQATKRCLIIAIGKYAHMRPISSENDVPLIKSALETQGFTDFRILKNEQASRLKILLELEKIENDSKPGDIIVIHFASHGQGIPDDNGDEPDGIDESICCYGAEAYLSDTYKGEEHLRDDEFGEYLDKIRKKTGSEGQVLVLLDACYSGSGTRGDDEASRGISNILTEEGEIPFVTGKDDITFKESRSLKGTENFSPLIVFSGSRADEKNFEYNGVGSLSYAFNKAFSNINGKKTTYRSLFAEINSIMRSIVRHQFPVAEGEGLDLLVFNSELKPAPEYYTINEYDPIKKEVKISGGSIAGISINSELAIYPAGTYDTISSSPAFFGVVSSSSPLSAIAVCSNMPEDILPESYWCFVTSTAVAFADVSVSINDDITDSLRTRLLEEFEGFRSIKVLNNQTNCDLRVIKGSIEGQVKVIDNDNGTIICESERDFTKLKSGIKQFTRARMFETLNMRNEDIQLMLELIPVKFDGKTKKITDTLKIEDLYENGVLTVTGNDYFLFKIKNEGIYKAYFNIIHINDNATLDLFVPFMKLNEDPANYFIDAGDEFTIPNFIYKFPNLTDIPVSSSTIKVIASANPIDLRYAFMKERGSAPGAKKGKPSILEEIIKLDNDFLDRSGITAPADEMISTFTLTIRKRK